MAAVPVTIRVLLADDQPLVLAGLRTILEAEPDIDIVGEAQDGRSAISLARELRPDLVLMDVRMPNMDGLAATRELTAAGTEDQPIRVVVLTTFDLDEYVYEALRAGASGFLVKDLPDHELIAGVRAAAMGETTLAPSVIERLIDTYTRRPPSTELPPAADELTPRELEVWRLMAKGLSNSEIASELVVGEATVKTHVARIVSKLGVRDRIQAIVLAHESGLL
jgi:DNA-binding NarL/FixJ family response regulator